jgi:sporulation protein YlmC with PRC-barrel domain
MNRSILKSAAISGLCLGLGISPLVAQTPPAATTPLSGDKSVSDPKPAEKCLADLRTFSDQMEKDGYWLGGSGFGYGYPMGGYPEATMAGYQSARPGYEVRILVAAANILGHRGQQQACDGVLATTQDLYKRYAADMHNGGGRMADVPGWRRQEIATALPVTGRDAAFRSDELLGTDVRSSKNESLGSVEDLVMSPKTGKIAYLVIGRGGVFGINEKYVPVPWSDFKATRNTSFLVLDAAKATMDGAPQVKKDQFATGGHFDQQSDKVDAYWKAHPADKTGN